MNLELIKYRKAKKISQVKLAKLVGVSQQAISKYELGSVKPSPEIAKKIADILDIPVELMFAVFYGN